MLQRALVALQNLQVIAEVLHSWMKVPHNLTEVLRSLMKEL